MSGPPGKAPRTPYGTALDYLRAWVAEEEWDHPTPCSRLDYGRATSECKTHGRPWPCLVKCTKEFLEKEGR